MRGQTVRGTHRHLVTVQSPGPPVSDGDGGFTQSWIAAVPSTWYVSIVPATARDLERVAAGTVIATASHVITGDYHAGVNTSTRLVFQGRVFQVTGVSDPEERHIRTIALCVELLEAPPVVDTSWIQSAWLQ